MQGSYTNIHTGRRVYYFGLNTAHSDTAAGIAVAGNGDFFVVGETYATDGSGKRAAIARFAANGDYATEALNDGLGNNAAYRSVQLSDANAQRVLVGVTADRKATICCCRRFRSASLRWRGTGLHERDRISVLLRPGLGEKRADQAAALTLYRTRGVVAGSFVGPQWLLRQELVRTLQQRQRPQGRPDLPQSVPVTIDVGASRLPG